MKKRRHRSRRALGATSSCSKLSYGTRRVAGIGIGALIGAGATFGTWYLATRENRKLQAAAGAPMPAPNLFVGLGALTVAAAGGAIGYHVGMKKPVCSD